MISSFFIFALNGLNDLIGRKRAMLVLILLMGYFLPKLIESAERAPRVVGEVAVVDPTGRVTDALSEWLAPEAIAERRGDLTDAVADAGSSQGVPMLLAGDEFGRTQRGNNNAYCQDNEISWVDWDLAAAETESIRFVRDLIRLRLEHPVFRRIALLDGVAHPESLLKDVTWLREDGLTEKCRTWLRLSHLFEQFDFHVAHDEEWQARAAVAALLDIATVLARADIKSELLKELERYRQSL